MNTTGEPFDPQVAAAVRAGLSAKPKWLPPWLFYDHVGSELFEAITELPEYYLTRTERAIFSLRAKEIVNRVAGDKKITVVELGSGSADKSSFFLRAIAARQGALRYEPVDVSASALEAARQRIARELPQVEVLPRVQDYTQSLLLAPEPEGTRRLVLSIGSSLGNFDPPDAARLLGSIRAALTPGDCLLLGLDLVKDEPTLLAAYNDAAGVTAAFNRNLLNRLNRELGANFRPRLFEHRALWSQERSRIEMHLVSLTRQTVAIAALGLEVEFEASESIHTENSYKYQRGEGERLLHEAGFAPSGSWRDLNGWFEVCLGRAQ